MKIKDGFTLLTIDGQSIVVPESGARGSNKIMKISDTGRFLWEKLQSDTTVDELVSEVLKEYDVDAATARAHINQFVEALEKKGFLC